ncbi:xanthine/CO dehydrogenase XdhC/CoxF family maturation factor [Actinoplanes octamycinicus]|uniref:Xanthine/CO dehydrogenase XdhC/CoxF family maturation factor n=1 Tax=Actinoplanes octamycinicus TaxID=135948 RepID=A0A7W7GWB6_9ACTN|nr:XdhC family protein [Actinoplanes octamycinicus]MBB4739505.1 xanthine/CO dehydrogenase XdhC/CoxF family maturation factor [Actinoplanes octamycinicus]GIE54688.1 xanthine dehydrogenase accessory factor [Actinoplanes octamycinicus]
MSEGQGPRRLVAVFASPVAEMLGRFGIELGYQVVVVEPDPTRLQGTPRPHGDRVVADLAAAAPDEHTDVLLTDHHRPEIGTLLREALAGESRWIGILGNPRHEGPHVAALRELGVPDEEIARVHRPVGLNIGSRTPPEIALAVLAGLIADRNDRPGGFAF